MSHLWSSLGQWVILTTAATNSLAIVDVQRELRRSGASAIVWAARHKTGKPISLAEARRLALGILEETELRLEKERAAEAHFIVSFWNLEGAQD